MVLFSMSKANTIIENLREDVENNVYTGRLPSIRALAEKYDVNLKPSTKRSASFRRRHPADRTRRGTFVNSLNARPSVGSDPADKVTALFVRQGDMFEDLQPAGEGLHDNGFSVAGST